MITLKAEKRNPNVKAKKLRREGYVTGILSGKEMKEPVALQFNGAEAAKFIKANKEGTQVYLDIEGEKVDALVKNIDYNPIEKQLMALDFQALVAGEKVSTTVAVKLEHTDMVQGIVEQEMEEIHYKADPSNLLDTIVIDFNGYPADVRDIHVKDLPIPEGKHVHFITPEDAVVVHIGEYEAAPDEDEDADGLVKNGVRIYEWTPGFCHAKMSVADDCMATCGTINLDYRSLYHHFENGCFMADSPAVLSIRNDLEKTMKECREVTEQYRTGRSAYLRLGQLFMRLFAGLL